MTWWPAILAAAVATFLLWQLARAIEQEESDHERE